MQLFTLLMGTLSSNKMMLNVLIIARKPLTQRQELAIIQLVSVRSLAPGNDMIAKELTTPLQKVQRAKG